MRHRTGRSVALVLAATAALAVSTTVAAAPAPPGPDDLVIRFENIETHARAHSPRARPPEHALAAILSERHQALRWSNPALAYDHEQSPDFTEWQLSLHKRFSRPLGGGERRLAWDARVESAELRRDQRLRELVVSLRAGYVELRLLTEHLDRLARLAGLIDLTAEAAASRHREGDLAGLDRQLIERTAYTVDATRRQLQARHRRQLAAWRADMGIPAGQPLALASPVGRLELDLEPLRAGPSPLAQTAAVRSQAALGRSLGLEAAASRTGLLPALEIYGGYRRFAPGDDGLVAGVALELPILDRGDDTAGQFLARQRELESELAADLSRREHQVRALLASIIETEARLDEQAERIGAGAATTDRLGDTLLVSFQEGAISLSGLLNAVQIEAGAIEARHEELGAHYRNVFELEAITGLDLVRPQP